MVEGIHLPWLLQDEGRGGGGIDEWRGRGNDGGLEPRGGGEGEVRSRQHWAARTSSRGSSRDPSIVLFVLLRSSTLAVPSSSNRMMACSRESDGRSRCSPQSSDLPTMFWPYWTSKLLAPPDPRTRSLGRAATTVLPYVLIASPLPPVPPLLPGFHGRPCLPGRPPPPSPPTFKTPRVDLLAPTTTVIAIDGP